ncbi:hypothetical protein [Lysobacter sp. Root494]|uniref:hypothetical protein n=1 Tax=Lysobacter sp. Root494 TaxID=1736549 RepID=UPI0006FB3926|nr:hypothetical protein [Lysobacter sp. Root494]KQY51945.1 hypothetical protein ASD14_04530 [Lysobacter sp. Root494]
MSRNLKVLISGVVLALHVEPALASGDMTVLLIPAGWTLLSLAFLSFLHRWPTWRQKLGLSACFFGVMAVDLLATAQVPYAANRFWVVPVSLALPLLAWAAGSLLLKSRFR